MRIPLTILFTAVSLATLPHLTAAEPYTGERPAAEKTGQAKRPTTRSVPEPSSLVALAFAGVVILARHRLRPL